MSVLISSKKKFYEIPDKTLQKCKITKRQFDKACKQVSEVAGQCRDDCSLVDLRRCCMDKKSYFASCL